MAERNVLIVRKTSGSDDSLYPKTVASMVKYVNGNKISDVEKELDDLIGTSQTLVAENETIINRLTNISTLIEGMSESNRQIQERLDGGPKPAAGVVDRRLSIEARIESIESTNPASTRQYILQHSSDIESIPGIRRDVSSNQSSIVNLTDNLSTLNNTVTKFISEYELSKNQSQGGGSGSSDPGAAIEQEILTTEINNRLTTLENFMITEIRTNKMVGDINVSDLNDKLDNTTREIYDEDSGILHTLDIITDSINSLSGAIGGGSDGEDEDEDSENDLSSFGIGNFPFRLDQLSGISEDSDIYFTNVPYNLIPSFSIVNSNAISGQYGQIEIGTNPSGGDICNVIIESLYYSLINVDDRIGQILKFFISSDDNTTNPLPSVGTFLIEIMKFSNDHALMTATNIDTGMKYTKRLSEINFDSESTDEIREIPWT